MYVPEAQSIVRSAVRYAEPSSSLTHGYARKIFALVPGYMRKETMKAHVKALSENRLVSLGCASPSCASGPESDLLRVPLTTRPRISKSGESVVATTVVRKLYGTTHLSGRMSMLSSKAVSALMRAVYAGG